MFKVGDKVRCVQKYRGLTMGGVYTVIGVRRTSIEEDGIKYEQLVSVVGDNGSTSTAFHTRFELVVEKTPSISAMTDQQLADEYRRFLVSRVPFFEELVRRGYKITIKGKHINTLTESVDIAFTKTETITL